MAGPTRDGTLASTKPYRDEITSLKVQLAECKKDSERWKAIVAEAERNYVEVPKCTEPYWEVLECTEAMEEWVDAVIAAQKEEA